MKQLVLIGAGGHCKSCIDVIEEEKKYSIRSILDKEELVGNKILNYTINGTDGLIRKLTVENDFLITVGQILESATRKQLYALVKKNKGKLATIISPFSKVSKYAGLGEGTIVMHRALINADARVGKNCIINTLANIEHDTIVGDHCHISTGAILNGGVVIGDSCFVGSGAIIAQNVKISPNSIIGAGCVVIKSLHIPGVYFGNPARLLKNI